MIEEPGTDGAAERRINIFAGRDGHPFKYYSAELCTREGVSGNQVVGRAIAAYLRTKPGEDDPSDSGNGSQDGRVALCFDLPRP